MKTPNEDNGGIKPLTVEVGLIDFDPKNRKEHDKTQLESLRDTIKAEGLLEPLVLRFHPTKAGRYMLIAGERRLRAIQMLKWSKVDVRLVDNKDEAGAARKRLVENMQREDLTAIQEARGYRELAVDHKMTQKEIAELAGVGQPTVANSLRLLELPGEVQQLVQDGKLTRAHGISLCRFSRWPKIVKRMADLAVKGGESSKDLEDEEVPYALSLAREKLIVEINPYDWKRPGDYVVPDKFKKDPDFFDGWCMSPEKWAPEKAAQDKKFAEIIAKREKGEQGKQSTMTPKEKAERQRVIADNKQNRAESELALAATLDLLRTLKGFHAGCLAVIAQAALASHWKVGSDERVEKVAGLLGIKLPRGFNTSPEDLNKLGALNILRLAAGVLADWEGETCITGAYPISEELQLILGDKQTTALRKQAKDQLAAAAAAKAARKGGAK
jgi:ParB/RepB/Spo0J family partition protein